MVIALSTTGRFSIQRCPQNGRGNTDDLVKEQKSSLLAGVLWKSVCNALSTFSSCQTLKPLLKALWSVWSPQLPTTISWAPPNASACSYWSIEKNFQLTFGPSIEIETKCLRSSCCTHSWKLKKDITDISHTTVNTFISDTPLLQINVRLDKIKKKNTISQNKQSAIPIAILYILFKLIGMLTPDYLSKTKAGCFLFILIHFILICLINVYYHIHSC